MVGTTTSHYKVIENIGQADLGKICLADHGVSSNSHSQMVSRRRFPPVKCLVISCLLLLCCFHSQGQTQAGTGTVSVLDQGIILELGPDDFVPEHLFDLEGKTLRFTPDGIGYRTEVLPLLWDSDFGTVIDGFPSVPVTLNNFQFPFSGTNWSTLFVNNYGSISFGEDQDSFYGGGLFDFRDYSLINRVPIISALFHRLGEDRFQFDQDDGNGIFIKELSDRIVVTWTITEPYRDPIDFITDPLLNRFQAVLYEDGTIELSYDKIFVKDGIVGIFTIGSEEQVLATLTDPENPELPGYIDILSVTASLVGSSSIRISFRTRGAILPEGDPTMNSMTYRLFVDLEEPYFEGDRSEDTDVEWGIFGSSDLIYVPFHSNNSPNVEIDGDTISLTASAGAFDGVDQFAFFVDLVDFDAPPPSFDVTDYIPVNFPDLPSIEIDLSEASFADPAGDVTFEAFHYADIPDLSVVICSVIAALGDQFDLFAFYTDFRLDTQNSGANGSGAIGDSADQFCSNRLVGFQTPLAIDTPIGSPSGVFNVGPYVNYNPQVALLAHELGHSWGPVRKAVVKGNPVDIGDNIPHWLEGLHAPSAFPIAEPRENSPMAGNHWTDNGDGTFTGEQNLSAIAYSYLDLYLMGLLPQDEVPDFFLIQNLALIGRDSNGRAVYSGDRLDITVEDVIAANGPRLPSFENSQKDFNLGLIGIVLPGAAPSPMLLERMAGIRAAFTDYWSRATGGVSTMNDPLAPKTVLVANFVNGNDAELNSRVYLFNPSQRAGDVSVRVFTLPLMGSTAQELTVTPLNLGTLGAESALNIKLAEDILAPLGITLPYTDNEGDLTLEFMIEATDVRGATQVFSSSVAFGTNPLQEIPSTSSGTPTVLVANFMNGNNAALNSRVYLWNPSTAFGQVTVRVFTLPLNGGTAQELTVEPFSLGILESKSALNVSVGEDILTPLGIPTPYITDGGNLTLEFTIQAADVVGAAQVFSSSFAFGVYPMQEIPSTSSGSPTVLAANFMNGNNDAFNSRVYLWNPSQSAGNVIVRVFTLPLTGGAALELTGTPLVLGPMGAKSALNVKVVEDILIPLGITTPYTTDGGNLTLEFTIEAADVRGAAQVFSSSFAFGTNPLQEVPSTSAGSPTVLVANFMNGNNDALNSRVYLWNPSASAGDVTVRVFTLPLNTSTAQELTVTPFALGSLGAKSALNLKLVEDILTPLGITTPYITDGGNLTLEFTIEAADVRGAAQVFSPSFAFGTYPLQVIP